MVPVVVLDDWRYGHRAGCCVAPWLGWSRNLSVFCATLSRMRLSPPRYETCWNDLSRQQLTLYRTYPSNHLINGHPLIFGLKFFISTLHTQIHPHQDDLSSSFSQNKYNTVLRLLQFLHIQWTPLPVYPLKIFTNSLYQYQMLSTVRTYSANARLSRSTAPDALYQWGLTLSVPISNTPIYQYANIPYWFSPLSSNSKISNDARSHLSAPKFSKTLHPHSPSL